MRSLKKPLKNLRRSSQCEKNFQPHALGENLGYADRDMQERTLLFYLEQTDDSIRFLKKEMETRTKLYRCLGMAAGLFLMVVMA